MKRGYSLQMIRNRSHTRTRKTAAIVKAGKGEPVSLTIRSRVFKMFSAAVIDQGMLSGTSLLIGLLLVRFTTSQDYAIYVLLQSALVLVTSAHSGFVCGPLSIIAPKKSAEEKRQMVGAVRTSQNRLLAPLVFVAMSAPVLGYTTGRLSKTSALVIGIGIIAAWTAVKRNYVRNVLLIYARARTLVSVDGVYAIVLLLGVLWAAFGSASPAVWTAVALAVSAWVCAICADRAFGRQIGWAKADARPMWLEMRSLGIWSVLGTVIYWLFSRSYNYILASRMNLVAVANVNEVRLMIMPAILLTVGLQSMLTPFAAAWNAEVGFAKLLRRLVNILLLVGVCELAYLALVWTFRDWVDSAILHKRIGNRDALLLLWIALAIIVLLRDVLVSAVYALGQLRWLAWQIGFCALVALTVMWVAIPIWGAPGALVALIIGEVLNLAGILYLVHRAYKRFRLNGTTAFAGAQ